MYGNRILDALAESQADFLRTRLTSLDFIYGDVLGDAGRPIEHAVFPKSGLVSLIVELDGGDRIEVAMVGHGGALGGAALFGATVQTSTCLAQLPGSAWTMRPADLVELGQREPALASELLQQEQYLIAQAQQIAACNARHNIPRRLCSWLLRAQEATGTSELMLTQEHLAEMLGVQRASVSMFASQLQDKGLIQYRRGRLHILDRDGLVAEACECHAALHAQAERLFGEPAVEAPALA